MNEKIKEIAKQSGYYLYDLTETHGIKTVETDSKDEWITLEKFAELIVKECLNICQECIDDGCVEAEEPQWKIEEYFGVEDEPSR